MNVTIIPYNVAVIRLTEREFEIFLDWWMVYRNEAGLLSLADGLPVVADAFRETTGDLVFLECQRSC